MPESNNPTLAEAPTVEGLHWLDPQTAALPEIGTHLVLLVRWEDGEGVSMGEVRSSTTGPYIEDWMADKGGTVGFMVAADLLRIEGEGNANPSSAERLAGYRSPGAAEAKGATENQQENGNG